nr:E3 binding domain-containing protein [Planctomycetota bacterium]
MIIEQLMPALSPTMEEGTIASWTVKPGDKVSAGQVIAEIQTDKTVVEWETLDDGYFAEVVIPAGQSGKVNMVAALITTDKGEAVDEALAKAKQTNESLSGAAPAATEEKPAAAAPAAAPSAPAAPAPVAAPAPAPARAQPGNMRVSPVAARIAQEHGVDLGSLNGSGSDGRIVRRDVEAAISKGAPRAAGNPFQTGQGPAFTDVAVSPMRQVIG